ncbi:two-component system CitB family sensor kinase [Kushneria sinocarnis]|uniref:histidine kinase n=1 Tax=Kushneria sinocarnis TaxID=595502 RepID=A0A420WZM3_9GAMM|nr:ATP-binding protein [Kushneria sinocarnis]RKR06742.1 two-component system CitB family sensor kinase [Kushneria sinocarnis]
MRLRRKRMRLGVLAALLSFSMIAASLLLAWWLFSDQLWDTARRLQGERVENLATTLAAGGEVQRALAGAPAFSDDSSLQRHMEGLRKRLGVDFIVVMTPQALRLTHPDPGRIGQHFRGDDEHRALAGERYVSTARGTLGASIRGFAPVRGPGGEVIGAVSVGVTQSRLAPLRASSRQQLLVWLGLILLLGGGGAAWLARTIKRRLLDMEPDDIARLVAERRAMLDAMHEGVIAMDGERRVSLVNPAAHRLLADAGAAPIEPGQQLEPPWEESLEGESGVDVRLRLGGVSFLGSHRPMHRDRRQVGMVMTFRDSGELQGLAEELTGVRRYAEALRASTHEFKNKLHVIQGLAQLGDLAALRHYLHELVEHRHAASASVVERVREPVLAGFLLGKQSEARECRITLTLAAEGTIPAAADSATVHALVSIIGNVLENAFEALAGRASPTVALSMVLEDDTLSLAIQDNGAGMEEATRQRIFEQGFSTRGEQRGLGLSLVRDQIESAAGEVAIYSSPGEGTLVELTFPYPTGGG